MPKGQSLNEYLLAGGLIAVVGIGSLTLMGNSLGGIFGNMIQPLAPKTQSIDLGFAPSPGSVNLTFTLQRGQGVSEITIPNYPANLAAALETAGADGTSRKFAAFLAQLADTLEKQALISPNDAALLRNLSNNGFELAELHEGLDSDLTSGKTIAAVNALKFINWSNNSMEGEISKLESPMLKALVMDAYSKLEGTSSTSAQVLIDYLNLKSDDPMAIKLTLQSLHEDVVKKAEKDSTLNSSNICNSTSQNAVAGLQCVTAQAG